MRNHVPYWLAVSFLLSILLICARPIPAGADAARCNDQIARGVQAVQRGRVAQLSRCLRNGHYPDCNDVDSHTVAHENELLGFVAADGSQCREALSQGSDIADFGPAQCPVEWNDCDVAVPAIADPDDLAACAVCVLHGHDLFVRDTFAMPRMTPTDRDERRCNLKLARTLGQSVRKGFKQISACARGGEQPFYCSIDTGETSRLGKALARLGKKVSKCKLDQGRAPGTLASVCDGVADEAELSDCLRARTVCLVCRSAEIAFNQGIDCAAVSGHAACDGTF